MARFSTLLLSVIALAASFAFAGQFKHIIIVVQENRTPDSLFGVPTQGNCSQQNAFTTGADIVNGGMGYVPQSDGSYKYQLICSTPFPLNGWDEGVGALVDPGHTYTDWEEDYLGWEPGVGYTNNLMGGFCHSFSYKPWGGACPAYSYVRKSDVRPYFDIATNYGFANYMFQSHMGPSMPPHQFLFTGTSAPVSPNGDNCNHDNWSCAYDFIADDVWPTPPLPSGCAYTHSKNYGWPKWVEPDGTLIDDPRQNKNKCYTHDSLVTDAKDCTNQKDGTDYCDRGVNGEPSSLGWGYYVEPSSKGGVSIWDAPAFLPEVCYGQATQWGTGEPCGTGPSGKSKEWSDHIRIPKGAIPYAAPSTYSFAPIFDDILACKLPAISWVIPDWTYSDVPGATKSTSLSLGPSWVGDIIDVIGNSYKLTNQKCDYWGVGTGSGKPEPTAIFVVWDDFGGFFDHVQPWAARREGGGTGFVDCKVEEGQWGCGYTEGFRVPLLVVSPYTSPHVSGACGKGTGTDCPNFGRGPNYIFGQYTHDFGSILAYTEWNFGMPNIDQINNGYADWNAPDWSTDHRSHVPLSEFFGSGRSFTNIKTPTDYTCFQTHHKSQTCPFDDSWVPRDPDSY
jgi:phospholipase C